MREPHLFVPTVVACFVVLIVCCVVTWAWLPQQHHSERLGVVRDPFAATLAVALVAVAVCLVCVLGAPFLVLRYVHGRWWCPGVRETTTVLVALSVAVVFTGELGVFPLLASTTCDWPRVHHRAATAGAVDDDDVAHIAVVADPQLVDRWSYSDIPEGFPMQSVARLCDAFLRRAWRALLWVHQPHAVLLAGDNMWGPRHFDTEQEYAASARRFVHVFGQRSRAPARGSRVLRARQAWARAVARSPELGPQARTCNGPTAEATLCVLNATGNHDVGTFKGPSYALARSHGQHTLLQRWESMFGPFNWHVRLGPPWNVTVVQVASPLWEDSRFLPHVEISEQTSQWIQRLPTDEWHNDSDTVILMTHVPLHREGVSCGPNAVKPLHHVRGRDWVSHVSPEHTQALLCGVGPHLTVSGDFHDVCEVEHWCAAEDSNGDAARRMREVTVPTFSWLEGTLWPGYALVSAAAGGNVGVRVCRLPTQVWVYVCYGVYLAAVCALLAVVCVGQHVAVHAKFTWLPGRSEPLPRRVWTCPSPAQWFHAITTWLISVAVVTGVSLTLWVTLHVLEFV